MDGSVAMKTIQIHRGPGLCPPRGPCESLPCAALWGNILRVLYLHDNAIPKNQLWRNGRKPGEVIGCRPGEGEGPGLGETAGRWAWSSEGGAKRCGRNIKQAVRGSITVRSGSDLLLPADHRKRTESRRGCQGCKLLMWRINLLD